MEDAPHRVVINMLRTKLRGRKNDWRFTSVSNCNEYDVTLDNNYHLGIKGKGIFEDDKCGESY